MLVNCQYFSKEAVAAGEMTAFIKLLTEQAYGEGESYNDIHIRPEDCGAFIVEWVQLPWEHEYGGEGFVYVDEEHVVMLEREYPDRHYDYFFDEEDYNERLQEWLKENPDWKQNEFGLWYNVKEQEAWERELNKDSKEKTPVDFVENGVPQGE